MKVNATFLFVIGFVSLVSSQTNTSRDYGYYNSLNLEIGYGYSFGEPNERDFHLLDLGIDKMRYGGRHGGGFQYGLGTEIGLNTKNFIVGPKISGVIYSQFIVLGAQLISYTDFDKITLRCVPFLGIGGEKFKLTINPHLILINRDFQPINKGAISFTINLGLKRKRAE